MGFESIGHVCEASEKLWKHRSDPPLRAIIASGRDIVNTVTVNLTLYILCYLLPPPNHPIHYYLRPVAPYPCELLTSHQLYEAMLSRAVSQESNPYPIASHWLV